MYTCEHPSWDTCLQRNDVFWTVSVLCWWLLAYTYVMRALHRHGWPPPLFYDSLLRKSQLPLNNAGSTSVRGKEPRTYYVRGFSADGNPVAEDEREVMRCDPAVRLVYINLLWSTTSGTMWSPRPHCNNTYEIGRQAESCRWADINDRRSR